MRRRAAIGGGVVSFATLTLLPRTATYARDHPFIGATRLHLDVRRRPR